MTPPVPYARYFAAVVAAVAAFALVLQYALLIRATLDTVGPFFATVRFFTYFTILSNLLALLVTSTAAFAADTRFGRWLTRPVVSAGVALYIGVTMGIYATVLQQLWEPQGAQWWADSSLHYAVPMLYLLWWLIAVPHGALRWRDVLRWLLFPLLYLGWVLVRGAFVQEYPYPFLDLNTHNLAVVLGHCAGVFALFLLLGSVLVLLDHWRGRVHRPAVATT